MTTKSPNNKLDKKSGKNYWLMKSEPDAYSIDDLKRDKKTRWDGVRNYQARNFMMKEMQVGDEVLFYHSNSKPSGVVGIAVISAEAAPDATATNPKSDYYDPKASKENPRWFCVEVMYKKKFKNTVSLQDIKEEKKLKDMLLVRPGQRLSIQPVTAKDFLNVLKMTEA